MTEDDEDYYLFPKRDKNGKLINVFLNNKKNGH